jgi:hypothetical protein
MTTQRSNKRHVAAKRLMLGVAVALIAGAAFAPGLKPHHGSSQGARAAMAVGGPGGALAGGATGPSGQGGAALLRAPQAHDDGAASKGESGLKLLVDDVAGNGSGPKGAAPGGGTSPDPKGVEPGLPESFQVAENDTHPGGFGVGGGGGFGGGGGAGGSGGGGTGGDPGGTTSKPSPDDAPPVQPVVTLPDVDHGGDGPVCALSTGCDLTAPKGPTPPKADNHEDGGDLPRLPPGGEPKTIEAGAIPEPASWLMMIAGFAALGATLRVRRRKAELA